MNRQLETTDRAFGHVVEPLQFQRKTLAARLLWSPLPPDWDVDTASIPRGRNSGSLPIADALIEHRAILTRADGAPFSVVVETYTSGILDFEPPEALTPAAIRGSVHSRR